MLSLFAIGKCMTVIGWGGAAAWYAYCEIRYGRKCKQ